MSTAENVVPDNGDVAIAIVAALLVPEAGSMHEFVLHCTGRHASVAKRHVLHTATSSHMRTASVNKNKM